MTVRLRIPLFARILGWFFLNLLLLVVIALAFFRLPLQWGLDAIMAGQSGERIESFNQSIGAELHSLPRQSWDDQLTVIASAAGVQLGLFRLNGDQIAGPELMLPPEVRQRFDQIRPGPPPRPDGWPPVGNRPPSPPDEFSPDSPRKGQPPTTPRILLHAGKPAAFWVLARSSLLEARPNDPRPGGPLILVIVSQTLGAHGLIFDYQPWLLAAVGVIGLSALIWLPFIARLTHSITRLTRATGKIADGHFDTRVPVKRSDEIGTLGQSINRMAERIAGQLQGQKRFLGDTAHELVSPLARMEMALGILEQQAVEKDRAYLADVREEVRHMSGLVHELLSFSHASLGAKNVQLTSVALRELVEQTIQRDEIAEARVEIEPTLLVLADFNLLQRSVGNILRNAQKYAGNAGPIEIKARRIGQKIQLTFADSGPGVPDAALTRLFDPFFRVDDSRDRQTGGTGLGLAIAKTSIEACGGTIICQNRKPTGLEVVVTLLAA